MPPADLIVDNVAATEITALGEITAARVTATDGSTPAPTTGYVHVHYEVDILKQFTGERLERMRLVQGVEAGFKPRQPGTLLFFSACLSTDGSAYEPDVGYFFSVTPECQKQVSELATLGAKNLPAAESRGSACRE